MRRLVACVLLLALMLSSVALAGRGDPKRKLDKVDQARAKAMLLRKSDLPGFKATPPRLVAERMARAMGA